MKKAIDSLWNEIEKDNRRWSKAPGSSSVHGHFSEYSYKMDLYCGSFLKQLCNLSGVGHVKACHLYSMLGMLGFLPPRCIQWSTISSKSSGGFRFLRGLSSHRDEQHNHILTLQEATYMFWESQYLCERVFKVVVPLCLLENILCETLRQTKALDGVSRAKDCFFRYGKRVNAQAVFRLKFESDGRSILEMKGWKDNCTLFKMIPYGTKTERLTKFCVSNFKQTKKSRRNEDLLTFSECDDRGKPKWESQLKLHQEIRSYFK